MKADWAIAIRQALPKDLVEYSELQQNEFFFITKASIVSTSLEIYNGIIWRRKLKPYRSAFSDFGIKRI